MDLITLESLQEVTRTQNLLRSYLDYVLFLAHSQVWKEYRAEQAGSTSLVPVGFEFYEKTSTKVSNQIKSNAIKHISLPVFSSLAF